MIENLTDAEILQGLRQYDEKVTREFFYDNCHIAYCVDDKKYGLRYKSGMDFYTLAHEYYLRLCNNHWHQLEKQTSNIPLSRWLMNGFHFLVRERLKTYSNSYKEESIEERASKGKMVFDAPEDNTQAEVKGMIEDICHAYYHSDRKSQSILRMILIMGMKGKEVAELMGITPAAVSQRYHTMMDEVVRPYFMKYYTQEPALSEDAMPLRRFAKRSVMDFCKKESTERERLGRISMVEERRRRRFFSDSHSLSESAPVFDINHRITPPIIKILQGNEIFVFGSDLRGIHCGGTAYQALRSFGAQLGKGVGPQGRCYAIPTIVGGIQNIQPYITEFFQYTTNHPEQTFLVTPIGCGIAGFTPQEIAPLFVQAKRMNNIHLPLEFWKELGIRNYK